jgi:hypothetical protein
MESSIEKFKELRTVTNTFIHDKLIDFMMQKYYKELVISSAQMLDMLSGSKTITYENEAYSQYLLDFALHESKFEGKNAVQLYKEEVGAQNAMEERIMKALENSYTSLFRVVNTSQEKGFVFLKDVLSNSKNIRLTDPGMSKVGSTDLLIFTRILSFENMTIISGMSCDFKGSLEVMLVQKLEQFKKDFNIQDESIGRFIYFYNAFKNIV